MGILLFLIVILGGAADEELEQLTELIASEGLDEQKKKAILQVQGSANAAKKSQHTSKAPTPPPIPEAPPKNLKNRSEATGN